MGGRRMARKPARIRTMLRKMDQLIVREAAAERGVGELLIVQSSKRSRCGGPGDAGE
jgi:hypothetical protein